MIFVLRCDKQIFYVYMFSLNYVALTKHLIIRMEFALRLVNFFFIEKWFEMHSK